MGNANQATKANGDVNVDAMKGWPILFHTTHSDNISLSSDRRRAKRIESFCKGIAYSARPVAINERVYVRFSEVSTSWSGVLRFGFTSHDPATINGSELPRYACPDLTNKGGYWAKALPERFAESNNLLHFFVNRNGDVIFGINNDEKGVFFSGVNTAVPLWVVLDIYGNSTAVEFLDVKQIETQSQSKMMANMDQSLATSMGSLSVKNKASPAPLTSNSGGSTPNLSVLAGHPQMTLPHQHHQVASGGILPIRFHTNVTFSPLPFHGVIGRNVCLSSEKTIAVRLVEEYCNGYVFTGRPLRPGEKLVIQILSVDRAFCGALAFGMTSCDPVALVHQDLPDDSDLLLDRPEYWVVNKDVVANAEIGDELSFELMEDGSVRYSKNGHSIATLMHVDKTLPLWAFFDVYGSTQKIRSLGVLNQETSMGMAPVLPQHRGSIPSMGGLTVALPPPRPSPSTTPPPTTSSVGNMGAMASAVDTSPPPRPPPPRSSPLGRSFNSSLNQTPPSLPPKQHRPLPAPAPPPGTILTPTPVSTPQRVGSTPLLPLRQQVSLPMTSSSSTASATSPNRLPLSLPLQAQQKPAIPQRSMTPQSPLTVTSRGPPPAIPKSPTSPMPSSNSSSSLSYSTSGSNSPTRVFNAQESVDEAADNAANECAVCLEKACDSVLYTCGHICMCYDCALGVKNNPNPLCPICRQEIKDVIRIYRS